MRSTPSSAARYAPLLVLLILSIYGSWIYSAGRLALHGWGLFTTLITIIQSSFSTMILAQHVDDR